MVFLKQANSATMGMFWLKDVRMVKYPVWSAVQAVRMCLVPLFDIAAMVLKMILTARSVMLV
jgi:hypothetical protein